MTIEQSAAAALRLFALLLLVAILLGGCSATGALNALQPKGGVTVTRDIAYAQGERRTLDVYQPAPNPKAATVVVFFYGGGWDKGEKADYGFVGAAFARHGYLTLIPDYRLYPAVRWPDFLRDSALAVRWAKENADKYGGDPARLVVVGHSAGAYNAVELALDARWLGEAGLDPGRDLAAAVGLSGPYDFLPLESDRLKEIFGPEAQRPDTQPINHVAQGAPPLWLGTGKNDRIVQPGNSTRLAAKVVEAGGQAELHVYKSPGHGLMVGAIARPLRGVAPVFRDVTRFIDGLKSDGRSTSREGRD